MANSTITLMGEIQQQIDSLASKLFEQRRENESLKSEIENLRLDLSECRTELEQARLEAEYLSLSHNLASTPQALADARTLVADMIRNVDMAIAAIKKDPGDILSRSPQPTQ